MLVVAARLVALENGQDTAVGELDGNGAMHAFARDPTENDKLVLPVPGLPMVAAEHTFDAVIGFAIQFTNTVVVGHEHVAVIQPQQYLIMVAVSARRYSWTRFCRCRWSGAR